MKKKHRHHAQHDGLKQHALRLYLPLLCLLSLLGVALTGCASPATKLYQYATSENLKKLVFENNTIPIIAYTNIDHNSRPGTVYLYLEGDGNPWDRGLWPASDPNAQTSLMLPLLTAINAPSLYLARPCYGWTTLPTLCTPELWTSDRYSQQVLTLLNDAIDQYTIKHHIKQYIIAGHSGGGTLAMLLAAQRDDVSAVITIAGNLDHQAWTQHFGYLPLTNSLAPPLDKQFSNTRHHWHLIAGKDKVIPEAIMRKAISRYPSARTRYYPEFTHNCCWKTIWPNVIKTVEAQLTRSP